jgi:hypothetical protein
MRNAQPQGKVTFEVVTLATVANVLWDVKLIFCHKGGDSRSLRNVRSYLPDNTASHLTREQTRGTYLKILGILLVLQLKRSLQFYHRLHCSDGHGFCSEVY